METKVWRWCMKTPRWSCNGSAVQVGQVKHSARKLLIVKMSCLILYGNLKVSLLWFVKSFFLICEVLNTPNISSHRGKGDYLLFVCLFLLCNRSHNQKRSSTFSQYSWSLNNTCLNCGGPLIHGFFFFQGINCKVFELCSILKKLTNQPCSLVISKN